MKHFGETIRNEPTKNYSNLSLMIYLGKLGLAEAAIAAQVGAIGYGYYSILEKIIDH